MYVVSGSRSSHVLGIPLLVLKPRLGAATLRKHIVHPYSYTVQRMTLAEQQ
jgi:hypothetical protein